MWTLFWLRNIEEFGHQLQGIWVSTDWSYRMIIDLTKTTSELCIVYFYTDAFKFSDSIELIKIVLKHSELLGVRVYMAR